MLVQESFAGGDPDKLYFLMGPRPGDARPAQGWGLLVILPGGDGSRDFHPWCRSIVEEGLPRGFVGAQLVAPRWSDAADRVVWPRRQLNPDGARFCTEDLIADAVAEVRCRLEVDQTRVLALGWSSGGPPVYAGAFVAMSVFKPEGLPPLASAAGRRFYILHSPQDWISIDDHARAAERALLASGATVRLETYQGGHGWQDDPLGRIRRGIEWLAGGRGE
jgi:predicted esterase